MRLFLSSSKDSDGDKGVEGRKRYFRRRTGQEAAKSREGCLRSAGGLSDGGTGVAECHHALWGRGYTLVSRTSH